MVIITTNQEDIILSNRKDKIRYIIIIYNIIILSIPNFNDINDSVGIVVGVDCNNNLHITTTTPYKYNTYILQETLNRLMD